MLKLIVGAMKSGKTGKLYDEIDRRYWSKANFKVFYPAINSRDEDHYIVSRKGLKFRAIKTYSSESILGYVSSDDQYVFIDEFQFYDNKLFEVVKELLSRGLNVVCAGLDLDFAERPWEVTVPLYPLADEIVKLTSVCEVCFNQKGRRTLRLINGDPASHDTPLILIEGADEYIEHKTVCSKCYREIYNKNG